MDILSTSATAAFAAEVQHRLPEDVEKRPHFRQRAARFCRAGSGSAVFATTGERLQLLDQPRSPPQFILCLSRRSESGFHRVNTGRYRCQRNPLIVKLPAN
jgi:hypothetical protein